MSTEGIDGSGHRFNIEPLSEETKAKLREQNPDWAYAMCCGVCTAGCYVDALTGA